MPLLPRGANTSAKPTASEPGRLPPPAHADPLFVDLFSADSNSRTILNSAPRPRGKPVVRKSIAILIALLVSILQLAPAALAATPSPGTASAVVEGLHDTLTGAMKDAESLGYEGRFALIAPAVAAAIDQEFMARKSIGRSWKKLSDDEQARWLKSFSDLTVANYAGRFKGYSGEHFTLDGEQDAPHETRLVKTTLVLPSDENVTLNYRLHQTGNRWKIIDVYMNGTVSELSLRRSEYSSTVKRDGFEKLVAAVEKKLADFAAGAVDDSRTAVVSNSPASP